MAEYEGSVITIVKNIKKILINWRILFNLILHNNIYYIRKFFSRIILRGFDFVKELVCLAVFIILSTLFAVAMVAAGFVCQYRKKDTVKESIYECGVEPISDARIEFDVKYFNYAVLFLVFDIETIFLYPFAVFLNILGWFAVVEAFIFVFVLLFGLLFAIDKKMLRWL